MQRDSKDKSLADVVMDLWSGATQENALIKPAAWLCFILLISAYFVGQSSYDGLQGRGCNEVSLTGEFPTAQAKTVGCFSRSFFEFFFGYRPDAGNVISPVQTPKKVPAP